MLKINSEYAMSGRVAKTLVEIFAAKSGSFLVSSFGAGLGKDKDSLGFLKEISNVTLR